MPFPIAVQYILEAERDLNFEFPQLYKSRMAEMNGGEVGEDDEWELFPIFDRSDNKHISRTANHIGLETKEARQWGNFPDSAIAIASNGCGDYLILQSHTGSNKLEETIYAWYHETGEVEKLADSINEIEQ